MKKYIKASYADDMLADIEYEVTDNLEDYIMSGDCWSYDDVLSEIYAQIQYVSQDYGVDELTDKQEDEIFEAVLSNLHEDEWIDKNKGEVLIEVDDEE